MTYTRPLPNIDADIAPFWDAVRRHEFHMLRCNECGSWYWPAAYCRNGEDHAGDFRENMSWEKASGKGKIFVYNVHHWAFDKRFADEVPYVFALIETDEGPMFGTNIIGSDPSAVAIGAPVEIVFQDYEGSDVTLPLARMVE